MTSTLPPRNTVQTAKFVIEKMDCPVEERLIRNKLGSNAGIVQLDFDLMARELSVQHTLPDTTLIVSALDAIGMAPRELIEQEHQRRRLPVAGASSIPKRTWMLLAISGIAALSAEVAAWMTGNERSPLIAAFALTSILTGGLPTLKKGWIALKTLTLNINFLMSVAVLGAIVIGQWPEAAMVIFLFAVAETVEVLSLDRARNAIRTLMNVAPETATIREEDGSWREIDAVRVRLDQIVRVRPGERVPLDGIVIQGKSMVNQAPITGESMPVAKGIGDTVFAGTINENGTLQFRVTGDYQHTTLSRIVSAVQTAQAQRAPTQRFVDRFAQYYTPVIVVLAILVAIVPPLLMGSVWSEWIYKALVLLVIACPCALVISTPVTVVSGLAAAARHGILIKGGVYLEQGCALRTIAFDKTGTVTHGKPVITDVIPLQQDKDPVSLLYYAASLDDHDNHPIARAIVQGYRDRSAPSQESTAPLLSVTNFESLTGRGVRGEIDGTLYYVGNHRFAEELGVCSPALESQLRSLENDGKTAVILIQDQTPIGIFGLADTPRETSREAIAALHSLGVRSVMLTGDNDLTAQAIARTIGIDDARGNLLPDDKLSAVKELQAHGPIGMVGDGINDAPALATANIGFAMGAAGTATALETSDVALMDDDLRKLPDFIRISRQTSRVLTQNIAFALGIKLVFFGLALAGQATLWMAVFADMGASLLVVFNGMRLLGTFKPTA